MQNHNFAARPNFLRRGPGVLDWLNKFFSTAANNSACVPDLPCKIKKVDTDPAVPQERHLRLVK